MAIQDRIFGKPLATSEERAEQIGVGAGIPIFGLDALTSAAYGPEAALALLIPLGIAGTEYLVPIITAILILLVIVFFSYRQTIAAYPSGGGSYTVATENLGERAGLLAAAALMIDYILTAAVGISAGVDRDDLCAAQVPTTHAGPLPVYPGDPCCSESAWGQRHRHSVYRAHVSVYRHPAGNDRGRCLQNICGWRPSDSGGPNAQTIATNGSVSRPLDVDEGVLRRMRGDDGCGGSFKRGDGVSGASSKERTDALTIIIGILIVLLYGTAWLTKHYQITAMDPDGSGYQSLLSLLVTAVFGRGWFYFLTMGSVLLALALSANTAFADFPRLTRAIAVHDYLPHVFILRGRRLLFSHGVYALTGLTAVILILFKGVTDRLIPLYAIGAFLAFTLSQAGMVMHWKHQQGEHRGRAWHMLVNGTGAVATGATTMVVLASKFRTGAWVTALLIPTLILLMYSVKKHYTRVQGEIKDTQPMRVTNLEQPLVVIPMAGWNRISEKALRFGLLLSKEIKVVHVHSSDEPHGIDEDWDEKIIAPIREAGLKDPELVTIPSSFRFIISPLMDYILRLESENPGRKVAVLLPELVVRHWWENLLHNQRVQLLKILLLLKGNQRIVVVNIPWYL